MKDLSAPKLKIASSTLCEQIYTLLRKQILSGQIEQGAHLTEQGLSKQFEVSATPIREALRLLHGNGLIELSGRRGARVITPTHDDIAHAFAVRIELESLALREACKDLSDVDLEILKDLGDAMAREEIVETEAFFEADWAFHHFFASRANNVWLSSFLDSLKDFLTLVRIPYYQWGSKEKTRDEHLKVVRAVLAGDIEQAEEYLRAHISRVCEDILELGRNAPTGLSQASGSKQDT